MIKYRVAIWSSNLTPRYIPIRIKSNVYTKTGTRMFIAVLFKIAKKKTRGKWGKTTQIFISWWINIIWFILTMEYCLADTQKEWCTDVSCDIDEIWKHYVKSKKLVSKSHIWFHLQEIFTIGRSIEIESGVVASGWRKQEEWGC